MYTKRNYGFWQTFNWSKMPFIYGTIYAGAVLLIYCLLKKNYEIDISLPWQPISVLGIAVAFYLGFKNNASYDRTWEARKIWGGIVNNSRTFGVAVTAFIDGPKKEEIKKRIIYRHIAWMTALRYQLRLSREWEHQEERIKGIYFPEATDKYFDKLDGELCKLLAKEELEGCIGKANIAVQILKHQANDLQALRNQNYFDDFRHMEFHKLIGTFFDDQGRSERIKNFPFPRQYASVALWQALIFSILIPFGMLNVFADAKEYSHLLVVLFSALVIWVFFLMEKIGDYSENPFEGSYNDIPITAISRGIEIDLLQMIDDENIPAPLKSENGFLM
ncbi:multidrug transporter [Flavobacterium sp. AS60]|uniref:bestrophin family protein n=1 Tax=Flavobacterium anseongense TaxID=2910677 RepID=UPI001F2D7EAC|nr:bestrophin family ion channel [Flavobacterium sp. AS60]MCF6130308.1 multidrug transporter [Flavobacterium sp. AS60]